MKGATEQRFFHELTLRDHVRFVMAQPRFGLCRLA